MRLLTNSFYIICGNEMIVTESKLLQTIGKYGFNMIAVDSFKRKYQAVWLQRSSTSDADWEEGNTK